MKKLIVVSLALLSLNAFANEYKHYEEGEISLSIENVEALEAMFEEQGNQGEKKSFGGQKYGGFWECEAQAFDGAGGVGRGRVRAQAAQMAMNYCRNWSVQPFSCQVVSCYRF